MHVLGKGIIRFHAVYWPAMLLSAGVRLPDTIFVHEYLTAGGQKISKSAGNADDPTDIAASYGTDALRWWMLREVARAGDTDYTAQRLVAHANEDLAYNIGNLVHRTVSMVQRYRQGAIPDLAADNPAADDLRATRSAAAPVIDRALADFDFRRAAEAVTPYQTVARDVFGSTTSQWILAGYPESWSRSCSSTLSCPTCTLQPS